jgi:hypothetical protein
LIVFSSRAGRQILFGELPKQSFCLGGTSGDGDIEDPRQNTSNIAIERSLIRSKSNRCDGGSRVTPNAGERLQSLSILRELTIIFIDNQTRSKVQVAGASIVAKTLPQHENILLGSVGQFDYRWKALHPPKVIRYHGFHAGLLEHDLRNPNRIGVGGTTPGEFAGMNDIPIQEILAKWGAHIKKLKTEE